MKCKFDHSADTPEGSTACRYGSECGNRKKYKIKPCKFAHPGQTDTDALPCRYQESCKRHPDIISATMNKIPKQKRNHKCGFTHPGQSNSFFKKPCRHGLECFSVPTPCLYNHEAGATDNQCRNGTECWYIFNKEEAVNNLNEEDEKNIDEYYDIIDKELEADIKKEEVTEEDGMTSQQYEDACYFFGTE